MNVPRQPNAVTYYNKTVCVLFCFFGDVAFFEYFCAIAVFSLYVDESTSGIFSFGMMVFFYLVTTGWICDISLLSGANEDREKLIFPS